MIRATILLAMAACAVPANEPEFVTPELGLYRSAPLASRWADGPRREKCLYLALLPSGLGTRKPASEVDGARSACEIVHKPAPLG